MKHLTEEELIEAYYGEAEPMAHTHLAECTECSAQFAELKTDMEGMMTAAAPERDAEYGEQVWQALRPQLVPHEKKVPAWRKYFATGWPQQKAGAFAVTCAALVAVAFFSGRLWERHQKMQMADHAGVQVQQHLVLVVLADHLDRTERLLVSLEHADSTDKVENVEMQMRARDLLAANRLYRTTVSHADDPTLTGALDKLQGVLAEIANDPNLTARDLERIRNQMDTDGMLFEIRVLRARETDELNRTSRQTQAAKGATI